MRRLFGAGHVRVMLAVAVVAAGAVTCAPAVWAQSLITETDARHKIEERYSVEVLQVEESERDGVPVFVIRVMNSAGNYNEAFQVNVLVMDRRSGKLVSQFRHTATGVTGVADGPRAVEEDIGPALRERSTQERSAQ